MKDDRKYGPLPVDAEEAARLAARELAIEQARRSQERMAEEARTPPTVGSERIEMKGRRFPRSADRAQGTSGTCMRLRAPSCIRAPAVAILADPSEPPKKVKTCSFF